MTRIDSTKVKWHVQVRKSRAHPWRDKTGLFETRVRARDWRDYWRDGIGPFPGFGRGNVRVVRHISGKGK